MGDMIKGGHCRSPFFSRLAIYIWGTCLRRGVILQARYVSMLPWYGDEYSFSPTSHRTHHSLRRTPAPKECISESDHPAKPIKVRDFSCLARQVKILLDQLLFSAFALSFLTHFVSRCTHGRRCDGRRLVFSTLCLSITFDVSASKELHFTQYLEYKCTLWWQLDMRSVKVLRARHTMRSISTPADGDLK